MAYLGKDYYLNTQNYHKDEQQQAKHIPTMSLNIYLGTLCGVLERKYFRKEIKLN